MFRHSLSSSCSTHVWVHTSQPICAMITFSLFRQILQWTCTTVVQTSGSKPKLLIVHVYFNDATWSVRSCSSVMALACFISWSWANRHWVLFPKHCWFLWSLFNVHWLRATASWCQKLTSWRNGMIRHLYLAKTRSHTVMMMTLSSSRSPVLSRAVRYACWQHHHELVRLIVLPTYCKHIPVCRLKRFDPSAAWSITKAKPFGDLMP